MRALIAQVVAPGSVGGLETVVSGLLSSAARAGQPSLALALLPGTAPTPEVLLEALAAAQAAPSAGDASPAKAVSTGLIRLPAEHRAYRAHYRALRAAVLEHDVRLLHSHGYHADVLAGLVARSLGLPHVSTLHGFVGLTRRGRLYEWLQLRTLRRSSAVIAVSQQIAERTIASGVAASRVHVVPNAAPQFEPLPRAEAREALGLPPDGTVVGWVGRVSAEKGPDRFVALVRELAASTEVMGILMGDGPQMESVRAAVASVPAGRLLLAGVVPAAGRYLRALDALVLTSHTEGTPMVVLEAMQAGVPVVSTAVGGVPAVLEGGAGLLVPNGDARALFEAVTRVVHDASLAGNLRSTAADRVATRFGRDAWWAAHASLYAALGVS